jgi:hypothetical protein
LATDDADDLVVGLAAGHETALTPDQLRHLEPPPHLYAERIAMMLS